MFPVSDVIPSRKTPVVTIGLIAANSLAFLYALQLEGGDVQELTRTLGAVPSGFPWTALVTSAFVHDGWIQFAANMIALWIFGDNVEDGMGHGAYLVFYLSAAALTAGAHVALNPTATIPLIGASGAVAAVLSAYFVAYPRSQVLMLVFLVLYFDVVEVPAVFLLGVWVLLEILLTLPSLGMQGTGSAAFAGHLAGFAVGAVAGMALRRKDRWT